MTVRPFTYQTQVSLPAAKDTASPGTEETEEDLRI